MWPAIERNVVLQSKGRMDASLNAYKSNHQIHVFARLLQLIPTHRKQFKSALKSLVIISEVIFLIYRKKNLSQNFRNNMF